MSNVRGRASRAFSKIGILAAAAILVTTGCSAGGSDAPADDSGDGSDIKAVKIALSNNFNGNIWRKQMEASFETTAKENPEYFSNPKIVVSDGSAPQQAQQIQSLVLEGYEAILIEPGSPTGLNGAIEEACAAGVTVVVFDGATTADCAYQVAFDYVEYGRIQAEFAAEQLDGKGNILMVRGLPGNTIDEDIYSGVTEVLAEHPDMNLVGEVYGEWTESVAQQEVAKIIPSLPQIDGVLTNGNDGGGTLDAFRQAGTDPLPLIIQGNSGQGLQGWSEVVEANPDYLSMSISSQPSISSTAAWLATLLINDLDNARDIPDMTIFSPLLVIPEENRVAWTEYLEYTQIAENPTTLEATREIIAAAIAGDPIKVDAPLPPTK